MRGWISGALACLTMMGAACATSPQGAVESPPAVYVMRHLEAQQGAPDPSLTVAGEAMARSLAERMAKQPPEAIFVSATQRARQTAQPLADRIGVTPQIYDPLDTAGLVRQVMQHRGTVLVVGHSNTVPGIVSALGGTPPAPLAHDQFGDIWQVRPGTPETVHSRL